MDKEVKIENNNHPEGKEINHFHNTREEVIKKISEIEEISNKLTLLFGEEKKKKFSEESLKTLHEEILKHMQSADKIELEKIKQIEFFRETKNCELFKEIMSFCDKYNSKNEIEYIFYSIFEKTFLNFSEDNLNNLREKNSEIRILKFENSTISYCGETKRANDESLPTIMNGFGLFKNGGDSEYYLGTFVNDNFAKGIWVKNKQNYFIGDFKFSETKKNEKISFSGLIININNLDSINFLLGDLDFIHSIFTGISIKSDLKNKDIQFDAGVFKDGKKNSKDFLTIKLFLNEENSVSNFKIIFADYKNDALKNNTFIQDEFSLIKMTPEENKFYSELSYDGNLVFRGEFKVADPNEIIPIFHGSGILLDCESGLRYKGHFLEGKKDGKGLLHIEQNRADNDQQFYQKILDGEFENDNFKKGKIIEDGKVIIEEGEFDENLIIKRGKVYYDNNEFYDGEFSDNKRNGHGIYSYENKYEYHGMWKNGLRDGNGTLIMEDRDKHITGEWSENKLIKITDSNLDKK